MNDLYIHDEQVPINPGDRAKTQSLCNQLGLCVCQDDGQKALRFQQQLAFFLRHDFTPKRKRKQRDGSAPEPLSAAETLKQSTLKRNRQLLSEAFVVLRLQPAISTLPDDYEPPTERSVVHNSWTELAMKELGLDLSGSSRATSAADALWLHVGHVNFSSWYMGLLELNHVSGPDETGYIRLHVSNPAKASHSVRAFAQNINFDTTWQVSCYTIVSNSSQLTLEEMSPYWVEVQEFQDVGKFNFWMGWEQERRKMEAIKKRQTGSSAKKRKPAAEPSKAPKAKKARPLEGGEKAPEAEAGAEAEETAAEEPVLPATAELEDVAANHVLLDESDDSDGHSFGSSVCSLLQAFESESEAAGSDLEKSGPVQKIVEPAAASSGDPPPSAAAAVPSSAAHPSSEETKERAKHIVSGPRAAPVPTSGVDFSYHGELRYNSEQNHIMACCSRHGIECRKVRTTKPSADGASSRTGLKIGQGRPLGLLAAWLKVAENHDTAASHKDNFVTLCITRAERQAARNEFMAIPGASRIADNERARYDFEDDEPLEMR